MFGSRSGAALDLNQSSAEIIPINSMYEGETDRQAAIPAPLTDDEIIVPKVASRNKTNAAQTTSGVEEKKQRARNRREQDYSQNVSQTSIEEEKQPVQEKKVSKTEAASAGPTPAEPIIDDAIEQKQQMKQPPVEETPPVEPNPPEAQDEKASLQRPDDVPPENMP